MSNSLDPDQEHFVRPDLGQNCSGSIILDKTHFTTAKNCYLFFISQKVTVIHVVLAIILLHPIKGVVTLQIFIYMATITGSSYASSKFHPAHLKMVRVSTICLQGFLSKFE